MGGVGGSGAQGFWVETFGGDLLAARGDVAAHDVGVELGMELHAPRLITQRECMVRVACGRGKATRGLRQRDHRLSMRDRHVQHGLEAPRRAHRAGRRSVSATSIVPICRPRGLYSTLPPNACASS